MGSIASLMIFLFGPVFCSQDFLLYTKAMNDCECPKPKKCDGCPPIHIPVTPKVGPICGCPRPCDEPVVFFRTQTIPAAMGDSTTGAYKPANGMYKNMLVRYEADGSVWIYDSAGVYTNLKEAQESES